MQNITLSDICVVKNLHPSVLIKHAPAHLSTLDTPPESITLRSARVVFVSTPVRPQRSIAGFGSLRVGEHCAYVHATRAESATSAERILAALSG